MRAWVSLRTDAVLEVAPFVVGQVDGILLVHSPTLSLTLRTFKTFKSRVIMY